jgi:serine/threonine protein kinase
MDIGDDEKGSDGLPQLPSLPGLSDLEGKTTTRGGLKPNFSDEDSRHAAPAVSVGSGDSSSVRTAKEAEEADAYQGRTFGGFELLQKIGQGGMGVVYKARQVSLDRVVAIKILSKALSENSEFIKRFEREAKSIAKITHPNIVAVYDFGHADGSFYMVTEFVEGSNLAKMISERLMMQAEEVVPIMVHALAGLGHVAGHGIVHRDIKPDNILVTKEGLAKIADFGLAKDVTNDTDLTATGLAMGTPAYMSPEQCMGRKLDVRSDVYSMGITAYFALTGEKPFTGQSSFEIMTKQREHTPPPPSQLNPRLPKEISALIMRMMAKTPQDRFADANECRDAWIQVGERLNLLPNVARSGEYHFSGQEAAKLRDGHPPAPPPLAPLASPPPLQLAPLASQGSLPPPITIPAEPPPAPVSEAPRAITERQPAKVSTERRVIVGKPGAQAEVTTCARCGFLNRGDVKACQRCSHALQGDGAIDVKSQELEAQRLFDRGDFRAAADLFARLADKADDRRIRTVLRSKEREARKQEQEHQAQELGNRSNSLVTRGDLKGGLEILERGLREVQAASSSGVNADSQLLVQINGLRARIRNRRRLKIMLGVALLLGALAGGLWWAWHTGMIDRLVRGPAAPPGRGAAP